MSEAETPSAATGTGAGVARSSLVVMAGLGASIVVGLIRQRVIALKFGTGAELDAFTAANGIPELLFTMLAGGALHVGQAPAMGLRVGAPAYIACAQDCGVPLLLDARGVAPSGPYPWG